MRERLKQLANLLDLRDFLAFGGLAMVGYGLHLIYPPAAWIGIGAALFWLGAGK
jgi:hypothetical protein